MSVAILAVAAFFVRRRKQGGKGQPMPPPSQSQEVLEFYTTQPAPPVFSPSNSHLPYNPYYVCSPFFFSSFRTGGLPSRRFIPSEP